MKKMCGLENLVCYMSLFLNFCSSIQGIHVLKFSFSATVAAPFTFSINVLRIYSAAFGALVGVYVSLTSVILVDLLGLDKLTNAFGLLLLFQGIGTIIGPPIVGMQLLLV